MEKLSNDVKCIICSEYFASRDVCNEHTRKHFTHRKCGQCDTLVIVIAGLEFELHRPIHCQANSAGQNDAVFFEIKTEQEITGDIDDVADDPAEEPSSSEVVGAKRSPRALRTVPQYKIETDSEMEDMKEEVDSVDEDQPPPKIRNKRKRRARVKKEEPDDNYSDDPEVRRDVKKVIEINSEDEEFICQFDMAVKPKTKKNYSNVEKTIPCPESGCELKFRFERSMLMHRKKDHGYVPRNICPICGREFKELGNMKQHMQTHSDTKRYICSFCGKGFHLPYNLKEHVNIHTGERPYTCTVCGKTFNRQTLRATHMRVRASGSFAIRDGIYRLVFRSQVHTGAKPCKCNYEGCDRAYAHATDLKRHKRSAHGEFGKKFECTVCGKVFYENKFLTKHLNVHQSKL